MKISNGQIVILTNNFSYDFFCMHYLLYVRCSQLKKLMHAHKIIYTIIFICI